jgi:23S rRNA pseudouridine2605 synthase
VAVRLQKFLAEAGLGSRRGCEELIRSGRVSVDGVTAELGSSVDAQNQTVWVDGEAVAPQTKEYWLLNKPAGLVTTADDPQGRPTVIAAVPSRGRVFSVGRLDLNTTGLLVLTNDGELAARLLHPRYHVEKEYLVTAHGIVSQMKVDQLRTGVDLDDGRTAPADVQLLEVDRTLGATLSTLRVVLREGRKRQVRRMLEAVGHRVATLHRCRFANLTDNGLPVGDARELTRREVEALKKAAGLGDRTP